ncbi:MAG: DUF1365 domain-containing protein [Pseudomonadota bacterium]
MNKAEPQHSCLYRGWVRHERFAEVRHAFTYPTFLTYLSLSELPALQRQIPGFSARRAAPIWLRRADHAGDPAVPLDVYIRDLVAAHGIAAEIRDVRLLTNLRYWGHCFNPISVYYCFASSDRMPVAVVLEVTNTPWGQRHVYVLPVELSQNTQSFRKEFHVSPFFPLDMQYQAYIPSPGERLQFAISNYYQGERAHLASLVLEREPLTGMRLWRRAIAEVSVTWRNLARIYWQAGKLWRKGATYHRHPGEMAAGNAGR